MNISSFISFWIRRGERKMRQSEKEREREAVAETPTERRVI